MGQHNTKAACSLRSVRKARECANQLF